MVYYIGVSGHRELENPAQVKKEIVEFLTAKAREIDVTETSDLIGISALAEGADTLFAQAILEMGFSLQVILPFEIPTYKQTFSDKNHEKVFDDLLLRATPNPEVVSSNPESPREQNLAFRACGEAICNKSNFMLFVHDNQEAEGVGGTGDIAKYAKHHNKSSHTILHFRSTIQRLYIQRDSMANMASSNYSNLWNAALIIGLSAATLFACTICFEIEGFGRFMFKLVEFVLISIGIVIVFILETGNAKRRRINYRREAELLRPLDQYIKGGIKILPIPSMAVNTSYLSLEVLKAIEEVQAKPPRKTDLEFKKKKVAELIDDQIGYHAITRPKTKRNISKLHLFETIQKVLLSLLVLVALSEMVLAYLHSCSNNQDFHLDHKVESILLMLALLIPPILAAIEGVIYFKEYKKNLADSRYMLVYMKQWELQLESLNTEEELTALAQEIRNKMDDENLNWAMTMDTKPAPPIA